MILRQSCHQYFVFTRASRRHPRAHSPEWPPGSTGRRTRRSRRIWVSPAPRTAAWSRESSGVDCLAVWGEQSQSLWFLSRSSHSRLWRAGSTKQFETRESNHFFLLCKTEPLKSSLNWTAKTCLDRLLLTHVWVKQFYPCSVKDCSQNAAVPQITLSWEKHSNSLWWCICIHHEDAKLCSDRERTFCTIPPV